MNRYILHNTVLDGDVAAINNAIAQCIDIDELDDMGYSALHWAVINKQIDVVQILLETGADANVKSARGFTPKETAIDLYFDDIEKMVAAYERRVPQYLKVG